MTDKERKAVPREPTCHHLWRGVNSTHSQCAKCGQIDPPAILATAPAEPPKDGEVAALIEQLEAIQPGFDGCVTGHALAQKAAAMLRRLNPTLPDTLPGQCPRCGEFARLSAPVPDATKLNEMIRKFQQGVFSDQDLLRAWKDLHGNL